LPATASTKEVIASIAELSAWADGILVQLPLPEHIDEKKVLGAIPPWIASTPIILESS
jgi:methylenetetrahydrofolate dehydrogenase (NADP+)/methenyltetrahydrofolate cyclohydrolase